MKRTELRRKTELARTELKRGKSITRGQGPKRTKAAAAKARVISPASPAQRAKVRDRACVVCTRGPCHPAHLIDRSIGGTDDPRAVVPLCPECHRGYDNGELSVLEFLEPHWREELAYAVELVGIVRALQRVTNTRWAATR